jgi:hypothetical protein
MTSGRPFHLSRFPIWKDPERSREAIGHGYVGSENDRSTFSANRRADLVSRVNFFQSCRCRPTGCVRFRQQPAFSDGR